MATDVSTFIGPYPFRHLDNPTPETLLNGLDRVGVERAWVGYLPSFLHGDPAPGTAELERALRPHRDRLMAVPTVHPGLPHWERDLGHAAGIGAPAIRVYPSHQGIEGDGTIKALAQAAAGAGLPIVLTVRFEDGRQRHPLDRASDLSGAVIRSIVRSDSRLRVLVTHADRSLVEEVHFGLTPEEAERVLWDVTWIWGPPEDHLALLLQTVGVARFTFGTGMPLRIPEASVAKLDLLAPDPAVRAALLEGNLSRWAGARR